MHPSVDIECKTRLTAAEYLAFHHIALADTRSVSNLLRHLVVQHLRLRLGDLPADVRAALGQEWGQ